jgi:hypothetical protein
MIQTLLRYRKWVNFHTFFAVAVILAAIFYAWKAPKQKYPFTGISSLGVRSALTKTKKTPKKAKRVNKTEEKCRRIFESLFQHPFPSVRPPFLENPVTKKCLELDGFNPYIETPLGTGLAFEYDGVQHSKYSPYFHRGGPQDFVYQQKRDTWKDLKCRSMGILLIRIPYNVVPEDLKTYIRRTLHDKGVKC